MTADEGAKAALDRARETLQAAIDAEEIAWEKRKEANRAQREWLAAREESSEAWRQQVPVGEVELTREEER